MRIAGDVDIFLSGMELNVSSVLIGVDVTTGSGVCMLCMLVVGFGDTGGGVEFDFIDRDLFGGNAGGSWLELFVISLMLGLILMDILHGIITNYYLKVKKGRFHSKLHKILVIDLSSFS